MNPKRKTLADLKVPEDLHLPVFHLAGQISEAEETAAHHMRVSQSLSKVFVSLVGVPADEVDFAHFYTPIRFSDIFNDELPEVPKKEG